MIDAVIDVNNFSVGYISNSLAAVMTIYTTSSKALYTTKVVKVANKIPITFIIS